MRTALLVFLICSVALPAQAGFKACNKTRLEMKLALGLFDGKSWASRGWWTIAPKTCAELLAGPLEARYYYLYATDGGAGTWDGKNGFCVAATDRFEINRRTDCEGHGYDRRGFFEIDTGQARNYTQTLSD